MTYVMSDIHGNLQRFESILSQIKLQATDQLFILGDVVDRYPGGIKILRRIMKMPNVRMILGNHEHMMLNALGTPYDADYTPCEFAMATDMYLWHCNGGKVTHKEFNKLDDHQQSEIISFLQTLPLYVDVTVNGVDYKLVHAAPAEEYVYDSDYENPTEFAVWKRWREPYGAHRDYRLIFGHSTTDHYQDILPMEPWIGNNCIGIDCGSGYPESKYYRNTGRLACLRLDDGKVFYSEEIAA